MLPGTLRIQNLLRLLLLLLHPLLLLIILLILLLLLLLLLLLPQVPQHGPGAGDEARRDPSSV